MSFQSHFHSSQSVASSSIARALLRPKSCQVMGGPHNPPFQFTWTWNMESTYKSSWCSEGKLKLLSCSGGMLQLPGCSLRELFQLLVCILTEKHTRGTTLYMPRLWPARWKLEHSCFGTEIIRHLVTSDYFSRRWFYLKVHWLSSVVWISKHDIFYIRRLIWFHGCSLFHI